MCPEAASTLHESDVRCVTARIRLQNTGWNSGYSLVYETTSPGSVFALALHYQQVASVQTGDDKYISVYRSSHQSLIVNACMADSALDVALLF